MTTREEIGRVLMASIFGLPADQVEPTMKLITKAIDEAVTAERARCARLAGEHCQYLADGGDPLDDTFALVELITHPDLTEEQPTPEVKP